MHSDQRTALDGTLIRWHKDTWAWSDHSPVPAVYDLTATEYYNFRMRKRRWIEALLSTVQQNPDLHWIIKSGYEISLSGYHYGQIIVHPDGRMTRESRTGKVIPQVCLVPIADWDLHDHCIAAQWPHKDHQAISPKPFPSAAPTPPIDCRYCSSNPRIQNRQSSEIERPIAHTIRRTDKKPTRIRSLLCQAVHCQHRSTFTIKLTLRPRTFSD